TVLQCISSVREARGIHHGAVEALVDRAVDAVDRLALEVRVENFELIAALPLEHRVELRRRRGAVDRRLAPPEKRQVRALHQQNLRDLTLPPAGRRYRF